MRRVRLLLDENVPHEVRHLLEPPHEVFTVTYLGWNGIENGDLLARAAAEGFDALVTTDRGMEYEQNAVALACSVVVIVSPTNKIDDLRPLIPKVLAALAGLDPRSLVKVGP